jgi:hypothetical protein
MDGESIVTVRQMRRRRLPFRRVPITLGILTSYRTGHKCKNVDYAAYEYNVYVQCNYNEGKKKKQDAQDSKEESHRNCKRA